jgi:hypothetical protein
MMTRTGCRRRFYSLFYVDGDHSQHANLAAGVRRSADIYLECGIGLAKSCAYHGVDFAIVTNNKKFVSERVAALGGEIETIAHVFDREVPADASFYAAHFKLDLLRAFGAGAYGSRVALIDIDTILMRPMAMPPAPAHSLFVYDIAEQVRPIIGDAVILRDLNLIGGPTADRAYWYGGEFICGGAEAFASLSCAIDAFWPAYRAHYREFHHVGDEMIVTAALGCLHDRGTQLVDASAAGLVARWWTARTGFAQKPFASVAGACLLHLPADKLFLAEQSRKPFDPNRFLLDYRRYAQRKLWLRRIVNPALSLIRRDRKYVGRLG